MHISRAAKITDARRASPNVAGIRFYARRNQHGFVVGECTEQVRTMPIEKVRRFLMHGLLVTSPVSDFTKWGKDVGLWLTQNKRVHPTTIEQLQAAQEAMAAGKPDAVPALLADTIPGADDEEGDETAQDDAQGAAGDEGAVGKADASAGTDGAPVAPPVPKKGRKSKQA